jgi:hypothetical protein
MKNNSGIDFILYNKMDKTPVLAMRMSCNWKGTARKTIFSMSPNTSVKVFFNVKVGFAGKFII